MSRVQSWSNHFGIVLLVGAILIGNGCRGGGNDGSDEPVPGVGGLRLQAYVKASNAESDDSFGFRVALSGNTLAVASHNEELGQPVLVWSPLIPKAQLFSKSAPTASVSPESARLAPKLLSILVLEAFT